MSRRSAGVVEHHDDAGAKRSLGRASAFECEGDVELVGPHEHTCCAAEEDRLERAPRRDSARAVVELAQRRAERHLIDTRTLHVAAQAEQAGASRRLRAHRCVGASTVHDDGRNVGERFDVVHERRLSKESSLDGEGGLVARLAPIPLDRVEDRRLLAADVRAGAATDLELEAKAASKDVVAEEPRVPRLIDGVLHPFGRQPILTANVEVAVLAAGRERGDGERLDDRERIAFEEYTILERPGLALVGVADDVVWSHGLAGDRSPLSPGRERGAASPEELRVGHLADHCFGAHLERARQRLVAAVRFV